MTTPAADPEPDSLHRPQVVEWIIDRWPTSTRRRVATVFAIVAIFVATLIASSRLLRFVFQDLDILAYVGLFVACWIGAGGMIVPIPGVRLVSWLMIVQQGAALDPIIVALIAAFAMLLGQTSYFFAARAAAGRVGRHADDLDAAAAAERAVDDVRPASAVDAEELSRRKRYMQDAERRVNRQIRQHGIATVFLVCALPTPVTTITTTAAATIGMRYPRFALAAFAGFLVLSCLLVAVGVGLFAGIRSLLG